MVASASINRGVPYDCHGHWHWHVHGHAQLDNPARGVTTYWALFIIVPIWAYQFENQLTCSLALVEKEAHTSRRSLSFSYRADSDALDNRPKGLVTSPTHACAAGGGGAQQPEPTDDCMF